MNLQHLRYLVVVAQLGSLTRAAQALHIGQPALTQAVRNLEREVGAPLFDRTSRGVVLTDAGRRVVVLEARDRIGGRVWTDRADGLVTDLGASWIHGIVDSPVFAAAEAFGMRTVEFTVGGYQPDSRPIAYYGPDGERLTDAAAQRHIHDIHAADTTLVEVVAASAPDASYRDVTEAALARQGWDAERTQRVREYLEHRSEEQYGAWIEDLAAHGLDDDSIDGDEVVFPDGYDRLPAHLAEGLDVRLGHVVSRVQWSGDGVAVTTDRGTLTADAAVVTVPVGVLRSEGFVVDPPLPEKGLTTRGLA